MMLKKFIEVLTKEGPGALIKKVIKKLKTRAIKISPQPVKSDGLNIIGHLKYAFGNSETTRCFAKQLNNCNCPFSLFSIDSELHKEIPKSELEEYKKYIFNDLPFEKNMFFINGNQIESIYRDYPKLFNNRYNIGVWWWEFDSGLDAYIKGFDYLDEVVVFTDFIKDAVLKLPYGKCKITKLVYPFLKNWKIIMSEEETREKFGLKKDDFVFIFSFDYLSSFERKNPFGVLKAFSKAFSGKKDVKLLIKTSHKGAFLEKSDKIEQYIRDRKLENNLILVDDILSKDELMTLFNSVDCYVSLHRGEGLGLGMLESMSLGKPVIGTRYGGNLEFMNDDNSFLVNYKMIEANDDYPVYKNVKFWPDPDVNEAAAYMSELYMNRDMGIKMGEKAKKCVWNLYNLEDFGKDIRNFASK